MITGSGGEDANPADDDCGRPDSREAGRGRIGTARPCRDPGELRLATNYVERKELRVMIRRTNIFVAIVVALVLACAPPALAGKGGAGKGNAVAAPTVAVSPGPYLFGGTVYVSTSLSPDLSPWITMTCTQNGAVVGTASHAGFAGGSYYDTPFTLGPSLSWTGGAADCTFAAIRASGGKVATDGSTTIHVAA